MYTWKDKKWHLWPNLRQTHKLARDMVRLGRRKGRLCTGGRHTVYKPIAHKRWAHWVSNSFPCLPPTLSFTLLKRVIRDFRSAGLFWDLSGAFTTITFAPINFAAVHIDRCNCYARRTLCLPEPPYTAHTVGETQTSGVITHTSVCNLHSRSPTCGNKYLSYDRWLLIKYIYWT